MAVICLFICHLMVKVNSELTRVKVMVNVFMEVLSKEGKLQGGSNMTGTDFCVNKPRMSRSYLNHLVQMP